MTTVISAPEEFNADGLYVDLRSVFGRPLYLKCEGFDFAGSIKLRAAAEMVAAAERSGALTPGSVIVESSSGSLGVALSTVAASRGYRFVCVTDPHCTPSARLAMEAMGAEVQVVASPAPGGGFLGARQARARALCESDPSYVWLDQYANAEHWKAHYRHTAPAVAEAFPRLDVLFVGAGTTATLMGCARYFRRWRPSVRIVAVDGAGSVTFGGSPAGRAIPGLGADRPSRLLDASYVDEVLRVEEEDGVRVCHRLARRGFLFGGSTGAVVAGALRWLDDHDCPEVSAVALASDLGERYLDTVYARPGVDPAAEHAFA